MSMVHELRPRALAEPEATEISYVRDMRSQVKVNQSQLEELVAVLELQKARLLTLTLSIGSLTLVVAPSLYFMTQERGLLTGLGNAAAVFVLFGVCKLVPLWRAASENIWRTQCLILMQRQAINLAKLEMEGGGVAAP
ncbi:MAG TPA: hypothetical protein VEH76_15070 [Methylocystis sp.]|nr:hypothetical protein [Methylocystis sp.]